MDYFTTDFLKESLKKEIQAMQNFNNPHIVKMYDVYYIENLVYIVLEFCPDGDLLSYEEKNGAISEPKAR